MKITVLDKCTLTVGDIDFSPIEALGEVSYYDILPHEEIIDAAKDAEVLICNKAVIDADIMDKCKNLKYIGLFATGYNNISTDEARKRGIVVVNVPGYSTYSVAQLTMAFILSHATSLHNYNESTHSGEWIKSYAFSYFPYPITELYGKTLGVYGPLRHPAQVAAQRVPCVRGPGQRAAVLRVLPLRALIDSPEHPCYNSSIGICRTVQRVKGVKSIPPRTGGAAPFCRCPVLFCLKGDN